MGGIVYVTEVKICIVELLNFSILGFLKIEQGEPERESFESCLQVGSWLVWNKTILMSDKTILMFRAIRFHSHLYDPLNSLGQVSVF